MCASAAAGTEMQPCHRPHHGDLPAWRGDTLPPDPLPLIDRVRGAANDSGGATKHSGEVDAGSREENASNQKT
jgi:hypothetical protein